MQQTLTSDGVLVICTCPSCFVTHAIPKGMHDRKLDEGGDVYCPNGHTWVFTTPKAVKLKRQLDAATRERDAARASLTHERDQRQAAERSAAAYKGQATRLRTRASAGVCPVPECHRHFENLQRHMTSKHPGFEMASGA